MKQIVCKIQMGLQKQKVIVVKNDKIFESIEMPIENIPNFIVKQNEDIEVYLTGIKDFVQKIEQKTEELEITKYGKKKTIFHCI